MALNLSSGRLKMVQRFLSVIPVKTMISHMAEVTVTAKDTTKEIGA